MIATKQLRIFFVKLQRLKKQKRFLREKEQKMFDKEFFDVKELKRLKSFEQVATLKRIISIAICLDNLLTLSSIDLAWSISLILETLVTFVDNSQDSWSILKCFSLWDILFISRDIVDFFVAKFARPRILDSFAIDNEKFFILTCSSVRISTRICETQETFWRQQKNLIHN